MGLSGAIACSFFDSATGTVVQLNNISQESTFTIQDRFKKDLDGNRRRVLQQFQLQILTYESEGMEQLQKWAKDNTKVSFVLAGKQENILIYRPSTITVDQPYNFNPRGRNLSVITMEGEEETLPCWRGMNLLNGFVKTIGNDFGWADENSDGAADGYNVTGTGLSFVDGLQSFDTDTGNQGIVFPADGNDFNNGADLSRAFAFPIANIPITLSVEAVSVPVECMQVIVTHLYTGVATQTNSTFTTTGRQSMSIVTDPGTYGLHLRPLARLLSGSSEVLEMRDPALRTDGLSIYTE